MQVKATGARVFLTGKRVWDGGTDYVYQTNDGNFMGHELSRIGSI